MKYQVGQYGEAIEQLKDDYAAGKYSSTEYMDKLAELTKEQWNAVNSAESLEDSIIKLNETRVNEEIEVIEDEIDAYKKLTDSQIEALKASKDLHCCAYKPRVAMASFVHVPLPSDTRISLKSSNKPARLLSSEEIFPNSV